MRKYLGTLSTLFLISGLIPARSATSPAAELRQMLSTSTKLGQLEQISASPFHLKASFEMLSPEGSTVGRGSFDIVWKDARHYRTSIDLATGSLLEVDNGTQAWRIGKWAIPESIALAEMAALTPFLDLHPATDKLHLEAEQNGTVPLDCIATEPTLPGVSADAELAQTTYCLAQGNHSLRMIRRPNNWSIAFNDIEGFQDEYIARSIDIARGGKLLIHLHVDSLTYADDFSSLNTPPPANAQLLRFHRADVPYLSGELMVGQVINRGSPLLPVSGRQGIVLLNVHVDVNGRVSSAEVIKSPDKILSAAALSWVKQWRFRLSYRGNEVVGVDETIPLRFGGDSSQ